MKDGPLKTAFDGHTHGVVRQEFITYRVKGDIIKREIVSRDYTEDGDYTDSTVSFNIPIHFMTQH